MMKEHRRHVFLFRHCLRSTPSTVTLYENGIETKRNIADFTSNPLPEWNTPEYWCTEDGKTILTNTGRFLMDHVLIGDNGDSSVSHTVKVQFISDTSQRDVDTAFALAKGMAESVSVNNNNNNRNMTTKVIGMDKLRYDSSLFNPFQTNNYSSATSSSSPLCNITSFNEKTIVQEIQQRWDTIPPPSEGWNETIRRLQQHLDGNPHDKKKKVIETIPTNFSLNEQTGKIEGGTFIVKLFAQMAFYSHASGIDFLPTLTPNMLYGLLKWVNWSRSILNINNSKAAAAGSILAHEIIQALEAEENELEEQEQPHVNNNSTNDETTSETITTTVTIIVGHEAQIDSLATALGLRWKLGPPYNSETTENGGMEYVPSPPGSGMHFVRDVESNNVGLSYVYPVYSIKDTSTNHKPTWIQNTSGILESVPLQFVPDLASCNNPYMSHSTLWLSNDGVSVLKKRLGSIVDSYQPAVKQCYVSAVAARGGSGSSISGIQSYKEYEEDLLLWLGDTNPDKDDDVVWLQEGFFLGVALTVFLFLVVPRMARFCCSLRKRQQAKKQTKQQQHVYNEFVAAKDLDFVAAKDLDLA